MDQPYLGRGACLSHAIISRNAAPSIMLTVCDIVDVVVEVHRLAVDKRLVASGRGTQGHHTQLGLQYKGFA